MKRIMTITAAAVILICLSGCSSLIRQKKPASPPPKQPKAAQKAPQPPQKELTAAQLMEMTPEQLTKYHQERQKAREREETAAGIPGVPRSKPQNGRDGQSLVNSFMNDRPSREKRRRLGDVSRQLDYHESTVFPWRDGRRSEGLRRR